MNWEALGALGEIIGALAVVLTLVFLAIQVRQNTLAMKESNRLERAAAIDRHADSIGRWRTSLAESSELADIWRKALRDEALSDTEIVRLNNCMVNFTNTQRANWERAKLVDEEGLAILATRSIAREITGSKVLIELWERSIPWMELVSPGFRKAVDAELSITAESPGIFRSGSGLDITPVSRQTDDASDSGD